MGVLKWGVYLYIKSFKLVKMDQNMLKPTQQVQTAQNSLKWVITNKVSKKLSKWVQTGKKV